MIGSFDVQNIFVYVVGDWGRIVLEVATEDFEELLKNYKYKRRRCPDRSNPGSFIVP
jgi:hypothetical protein